MDFAITPRLIDDRRFLRDELWDPWDFRLPLQFRDGSMGLSGRMGESEVQNTDKEFRIRLDLHHYSPEEVEIKSDNHRITIRAKHEEKQDNHGFVSREIQRIYKLPEDVDAASFTSTMNSNGVLCMKAQKKALEAPKEVNIPIQFSGK